jgi:hypothetical protein
MAAVLMQHISAKVPWPRDIARGLSENLCLCITKMMAKDPADRYQSVGELLYDLRTVDTGRRPSVSDSVRMSSSVAPAKETSGGTRGTKPHDLESSPVTVTVRDRCYTIRVSGGFDHYDLVKALAPVMRQAVAAEPREIVLDVSGVLNVAAEFSAEAMLWASECRSVGGRLDLICHRKSFGVLERLGVTKFANIAIAPEGTPDRDSSPPDGPTVERRRPSKPRAPRGSVNEMEMITVDEPLTSRLTRPYEPQHVELFDNVIKFRCLCGKRISVPIDTPRTLGSCPKCTQRLLIPRAPRAGSPFADGGTRPSL